MPCQCGARCYFTFRALYTRHLCGLHTLSPAGLPQPALPALCRAFEALLQEADPRLCFHLAGLGLAPLRIALPWIVHGFATELEVDQVLLLWDRVIGFDTLLPIALLAVGVFRFKRTALLACRKVSTAEEILADLTPVRVVPLMQDALFCAAPADG